MTDDLPLFPMTPARLERATYGLGRRTGPPSNERLRGQIQPETARNARVSPQSAHNEADRPFTSHRYTRNSRGPGQDGVAVTTRPGHLVPCSSCGRLRLNLAGPHAPHYARGHLVDCVGKAVGHAR